MILIKISQKAEINQPTEKKLNNIDSYTSYIERMKKVRADKESQIEYEKRIPGSGCLWKDQHNLPLSKKFQAVPKRQSPNQKDIKSLKKVKKIC